MPGVRPNTASTSRNMPVMSSPQEGLNITWVDQGSTTLSTDCGAKRSIVQVGFSLLANKIKEVSPLVVQSMLLHERSS